MTWKMSCSTESRTDRSQRFSVSIAYFTLWRSNTWQILSTASVSNHTERSRSYPHRKLHHGPVCEPLRNPVSPFQKHLSRQVHYALPIRLETRGSRTKVLIHKQAVELSHNVSLPHLSRSKHPSSRTRMSSAWLFDVTPMALHATARTISTFTDSNSYGT